MDLPPGVVVAEPGVFVLVFAAAELSPRVVVLVFELAVVSVVDFEVSEPGVVFVADVAEPQASVDIAVAFAVLVPVSVFVVEVDSSEHPMFVASPNACSFPSPSSFVELVGEVFVGSSTGAHTNYGLCSILSNPGPRQNKNLELCYNNPSPGYNNVSDTNDLPMDATTNHCRRRCPRLRQGQHRHTSQAALSTPVVRQIRWAAEKC
ncbi:MAG: hypothetical protein ABFD82_05545 [Syntrophaceae bacterium]